MSDNNFPKLHNAAWPGLIDIGRAEKIGHTIKQCIGGSRGFEDTPRGFNFMFPPMRDPSFA